jgi:hypothetical protein
VKELREQYRTFVAAFSEAAARWRRGDFSASFPLFSFPPVLNRVASLEFSDTLLGLPVYTSRKQGGNHR